MKIDEILKTEAVKRDFLIGLAYLSKVDGVVDESEKAFFLNAAASLQLSEESLNEINLCWTNDIMPELNFDTKKQKLFFLTQAIQLSSIDNVYSEEEKGFVHESALKLDISKESVEKIENWVKEGIEWQNRGNKLLELEVE